MSEAEAETRRDAVYFDAERDILPHCNPQTFHEYGVCVYCDNYYRNHPGFFPEEFATPEANGWGGNAAPIVDDDLAAQEDREIEAFQAEQIERWTQPKSYWSRKAAEIKKLFS